VILRVEPNLAAKELDDGLADGKSQTSELDVVAKLAKSVEDMVSLLRRYALACVGHTDKYRVAILRAGQRDYALIGKLHSVLQEMSQQCLYRLIIRRYRKVVRQFRLKEGPYALLTIRAYGIYHMTAEVIGRDGIVDGQ
jgi:hypothetical protein